MPSSEHAVAPGLKSGPDVHQSCNCLGMLHGVPRSQMVKQSRSSIYSSPITFHPCYLFLHSLPAEHVQHPTALLMHLPMEQRTSLPRKGPNHGVSRHYTIPSPKVLSCGLKRSRLAFLALDCSMQVVMVKFAYYLKSASGHECDRLRAAMLFWHVALGDGCQCRA
eukprot:1161105-Pelagomonas_calceolata.AAC.18